MSESECHACLCNVKSGQTIMRIMKFVNVIANICNNIDRQQYDMLDFVLGGWSTESSLRIDLTQAVVFPAPA